MTDPRDEQTPEEATQLRLITAAQDLKDFRAEVGEINDDDYLIAYTTDLLHLAAESLLAAEECVRATRQAPPADLVALLELAVPEASRNLSGLRTVLEGVAHDRLRAAGDVELPDGRRAYATFKKEKISTDGDRILSILAARVADEWDSEPPAEFAAKVLKKADKVAGMTLPSFRWRSGALKKERIDLKKFQTSEMGDKTVGFTVAPAVREAKDSAA